MGKKQKQALVAMAAVMLLMFIFPPFHFVYVTGFKKDAGYGFVFNPPAVYSPYAGSTVGGLLSKEEVRKDLEGLKNYDPAASGVEPLEVAEINYLKLLVQWALTLVVGGVAFIVRKEDN